MNGRILSPLADPVFKKIFGEEKDIMMSLINAAINLNEPVIAIEYFQPELVGEHVEERSSIVDVRCTDKAGRHFIVEMQVNLHAGFQQRVIFNASKVYSRQLAKGTHFHSLQPVYAISIINEVMEKDSKSMIHRYDFCSIDDPSSKIEGIHLIFIELVKFKNISKFDISDPLHRWTQFFVDPQYYRKMPAKQYETFEELRKAIELLDESNFTQEQLYAYDRYIDGIRTRKAIEDYQREKHETAMKEASEKGMQDGLEKGMQEGLEKGMQDGLEKGMQEGLEKGMQDGLEKGMQEGLEKGMQDGLEKGMQEGLEKGIQKGLEKGMQEGLEKGMQQGLERGMQIGIEKGLQKAQEELRKKMVTILKDLLEEKISDTEIAVKHSISIEELSEYRKNLID